MRAFSMFGSTVPLRVAAMVAGVLVLALAADASACGRRGNRGCSTGTAAACGQQVPAVAFQAAAAPAYPVAPVKYDALPAGYQFQVQGPPQAAGCANGSCAAPQVVRFRR